MWPNINYYLFCFQPNTTTSTCNAMSSNFKYEPLRQYESGLDYTSQFTFSGNKNPESKQATYTKLSAGEAPLSSKQRCTDYICTSIVVCSAYIVFLVTFPFSWIFALKLVHQYERLIVYRLGRICPVKGPGVVLVLPFVDRWSKVDLRTKAFNVPPSKVCTTDGCIISIGAIVHFRIKDPLLMSLSVQDVNHAMRDSAMSDMTNLLGKKSFHDIKTKRQRLAYDLQDDVNMSCKEWGAEVSRVELSDITLIAAPQSQRSFMPMHGEPSPPNQPQMPFGGDMLGGLAQFAQQFISQSATTTSNEPKPLPDSSQMDSTVENMIMKVETILGSHLVEEIGVSFEFDITDYGKYFLDFRKMPGAVGKGSLPVGKPDVVLSLSLETLQDLLSGSMSASYAYTMNRLKIVGSTSDAMKLDLVIKSIQ